MLKLVFWFLMLWLAVLGALRVVERAHAHEHWINQQHRTNPKTNEWCCNAVDCKPLEDDQYDAVKGGYLLRDRSPIVDFVPNAEAQPAGDWQAWVCRRPDKTVRCFFFKPGSF